MSLPSKAVFHQRLSNPQPETLKRNTVEETKVENDQLGLLLICPIFFVQKADAQKNGVEFRQKSIGVIRCSLATLDDDM